MPGMIDSNLTVSVFGAGGTMGASMVPLLAKHCRVNAYDLLPGEIIKQEILKQLKQMQHPKRGIIDGAEKEAMLSRINFFGDYAKTGWPEVETSDVVIEAIPEILTAKKDLFGELDVRCPAHTMFFSNTSSLMIKNLHSFVSDERKAKMAIIHFMNPAWMFPFIELVRGDYTSDKTFEFAKKMVESFETVVKGEKKNFRYAVWPDYPGFGANGQLFSAIAKAIRLVEIGADPREVDATFIEGTNQRNGFLFTASWIGFKTCQHILNNMYWQLRELGDPDYIFYRPIELLNKLVAAGNLGLQGFRNKQQEGEDPYAIWTSV